MQNKTNIPREFFRAEYRNGYYVSDKMKKVWAVELDLLATFVDVCKKNNLNYFIICGTLLGAVRHKGFIPWDDDIDVIMPRTDYNKLCKIAEKEFTYPYFFQTTISEDNFFRPHAQLRNSETTGFISEDRKKDINKGIFIDIFILDGIPNFYLQRWLLKTQIKKGKRIFAYLFDKDYLNLRLIWKIYYILIHAFFKRYSYKNFFEYFNLRILAKYSNKNTELVGPIGLKWGKEFQWRRECFSDYVYLFFENLELRAPLLYREILEKQYGDFMKFPDDINEPNGRLHSKLTFEPDIPYKEYFKNIN